MQEWLHQIETYRTKRGNYLLLIFDFNQCSVLNCIRQPDITSVIVPQVSWTGANARALQNVRFQLENDIHEALNYGYFVSVP